MDHGQGDGRFRGPALRGCAARVQRGHGRTRRPGWPRFGRALRPLRPALPVVTSAFPGLSEALRSLYAPPLAREPAPLDAFMDHFKHPRNVGELTAPGATRVEVENPVCG